MTTFSLTIATEDDHGTQYDTHSVLTELRKLAEPCQVTLFSITTGHGIDTDTNAHEPIVIVQGYGDSDSVTDYGNAVAIIAAAVYRQRAIGWITSDAHTYRVV